MKLASFPAWTAGRPLVTALLAGSAILRAADPSPAEVEVLRVDAARLDALVRSDVAALRGLFAPDCVYTHGSGRLQTGEEYLAMLAGGDLRYLAMRYELPPSAWELPGGAVAVTGRVRLTGQARTGAANERIMAATSVYTRSDVGWRLVAFQNTPAPAAPAFLVLEQTLVAKDACAWPKLALGRDGTIYAAIYDQPSHGQRSGDVACWASADGGRTWEFRGNATKHEGNQAWFNHALGLAANGDLLVATSGWDYASAQGGKRDVPLVPLVSRSRDGGRTWSVVARFPDSPEKGKAFIPFGNIERGDDGVLRVAAYSYARGLPPPRSDPGHVILSEDDGATWRVGSLIGLPAVNETDLLHAGGNRWLAAARNLSTRSGRGAHSIDLHVSDDNGRTWRQQGRLTRPDQHPGDLLRLVDGRLLLTYGDRRAGESGVHAMLSADGGATWGPEFRVAGPFSSRDSGYPSSVQLKDGTIVTAFYAKGSALHDGYHMGVSRWRLE